MANEVKRNDSTASTWSARLTLLACLAVLAVLVTELPAPAQVIGVLTGAVPSPVDAAAPLAAVQSILLTTAGLVVWLLIGWAVAVLAVGLIARRPGRSGRRARRLLPRIAPTSIGRLVAAAVGVSLIAGTAACASPAGPAGPAAAAGSPTSATDVVPAPASPGPDTGSGTGPADGSITIDWPAPEPTESTGPSAATPAAPTTIVATADTTPDPPPSDPAGAEAAPATSPEPPRPAPGGSGPAPADPGESVTVQPGDSLWRIAARGLGPDADQADIDNAWRAWYFVNRQVIGEDPDLIIPGQSLLAPAPGGQVRP